MIKLQHIGEKNDARPLVAIPGIDGSLGSIEPLVEGIAPNRKVIVVDYSDEDNPTLDALADEIYQKVKAEISEPFYLSGQSIGTILAAKLAARDLPVQKVVLTCTFTKLTPLPLQVSTFFMKITPDQLYRMTTVPIMKYVCGPVGDGGDHPFLKASKNSDKDDIRRRTEWQINTDFGPDLKKISQPLLILMGEKDRFVPNPQREVAKLKILFREKDDFTIETIPNAGHVFLPSKSIKLAIQKINRFLR